MNYDPTDIRHLERRENDEKSAARVATEQQRADFEWLASDPRGRRILREFLAEVGITDDCFTGNSTTFYREGKRAAGLWFELRLKRHALDSYCLMLKEQQSDV
jgi:hypothetical protein